MIVAFVVSAGLGVSLVLDERGPAASFLGPLREAGVEVETADTADVCDAAALIFDRVEAGSLEHGGYAELDAAVDVVAWRSVGERKAFGRRASAGDISPLEAVALAALKAVANEEVGVGIW
jgi:hypothetical protein